MARCLLVAPDSFKGTFAAATVAAAIARGVAEGGAIAEQCPVADGGEGTIAALGGDVVVVDAHDPLGRPVGAAFAWFGDDRALVEVAAASGLGVVAPGERDAEAASSAGTGEVIAAAIAAGARHVLVAAGGSATTDGGAGALAAIERAGGLQGARLTCLCDVQTPFERAAAVYGPQKGARPDAVRRLTDRLVAQAAAFPRDPRGVPMTGAAGGLAGGLWAVHSAELVPGAAWVLDALGFDERIARADAVITGEGRLDAQTAEGKIVWEVMRRCAHTGVPVHAVVGSLGSAVPSGFASVHVAPTLPEMEQAGSVIGSA